MVDKNHSKISIKRQCELLSISRSSTYYNYKDEVSKQDIEIMNTIDRIYTYASCYWTRRLKYELRNEYWFKNVWRKRIRRLMKIMWLTAHYPKPNTSKPNKEHKKYKYLLKNLKITKTNQVWCADITYIRINWWFIYLVAIIDLYSRYVVSWELSNTLESDFCIRALEKALHSTNTKPEIFNTDQWVQFTSNKFIEILESKNIQISMDWKWRCLDNIFIERLWRTVKQEEVYLKDYQSIIETYENLKTYFNFYNNKRLHSSIWYQAPVKIYSKENQNDNKNNKNNNTGNWNQDYSFTHQEKIMKNFEIKYFYKEQNLPQFFLLLLIDNNKTKIKNTIFYGN